MKKIILLIIGAVVLVGLGGAAWYFTKKQNPVSSEKTELPVAVEEFESAEESFTGKIKEALLKGIPMKCTYEDPLGNKAVGFIKGKKYYAEITSQNKASYLIIKDDCLWTWSDQEAQGVKLCFEPEEGEESVWDSESAPQDEYHCVPGAVDDSRFEPPAEINFMNLEELMQGVQN